MVKYRIKVKDSSDTFIGEFTTYRKLTFNKKLNYYGSCSFEVPVSDAHLSSLIALRQYTVWIYREADGDSQLVWAGEQALRKGALTVNKNNWATIYCFTWFEQLNNRYTGASRAFDQVDQGEIAMTLIDETQAQTNGDLGITEGTIVPTFLRDREYFNQNIMEAIVNLTGVIGGFDFEITDNKVFNADSIIGVDRTDSVILKYGKNIVSANITEDFSNPTNRAIVLGEVKNGIYSEADFGNTVSTSHYLKATGFGFDVPTGATIIGVELQKLGYFEGAGSGVSTAKLVIANVVGGTQKDQNFSGVEQYYSSGGISDLWGNVLTPAIVNADDFGVALWTDMTAGVAAAKVHIRHVKLLVYYTYSSTTYATDESPSIGVDDATIGTVAWSDPRNITTSDATNVIRVERDDTSAQALYKVREMAQSEMEISELATFEDRGDAIIRKYASPLFMIEIEILPSSVTIDEFAMGDVIRLIINNGIYNIDETYRIFEYSVSFNEKNEEKLTLVMGNFVLL